MMEGTLEAMDVPHYLQDDATETTVAHLTQTNILRSTCLVYLSISAALYLLFLLVRPRHPRIYNLKKSFASLHSPLADDAFGRLSWTWKVFDIDYGDISAQCGMDAATTVRLLESGVKLSLVAVFNSAFLVPVYSIMGTVVDEEGIYDPVKAMSLSNLSQGHAGAVATTVAAYILFGAAMHLVNQDFEWFARLRVEFLTRPTVQNYTVYLSGLPPELRTNVALREYFGRCFSHAAVADACVALAIPALEKKVMKRNSVVPKLEHARNVVAVKGEVPTHKTKKCCGGERVESVPAYEQEMEELDGEIGREIDRIEAMLRERDVVQEATRAVPLPTEEPDEEAANWIAGSRLSKSLRRLTSNAEDGMPRNAAFVSFADLTSANLARQAVHDREPWACVPTEPPIPELVNWKNVGKSNSSKQMGELVSFVLTTLLCLFWTVPVSFVASLSNVEALTELFPFLREPVENYDWFSTLLALLAPLILVVFVSLLPHIILAIIKFEGLIEMETMQHPSLFSKLATFTIVQTFFISTIASTLFSSLQGIINNPSSAIKILAESLPAQSAYFIQIIVVQNLLALGIELLRISPVAQNAARKLMSKLLGHNYTEKERSETFLGLRSLDDPLEYFFGRELGSKTILMTMVLYVYGCISPITSYFTLLIFVLLAVGFRNQFIYIYPARNDSGGMLWLNFTKISVSCMIVAEIVICAIILLKESFVAGVLMVPLIAVSILFDVYFKRRHYSITSHLPLGDCARIDSANETVGMTGDWLKGAYLQPALRRVAPDEDKDESNSLVEEEDPIDNETLADGHKVKGNAHMSNKEYELALQEYNAAISLSGSGVNSHVYYSNRAAAFCYLGDYNAAADDCRKSIELSPKYEQAHTRLGLSLYFQGDYPGAVHAYEKALDLDPENQACFNYLVRAKEKLHAERYDEIELPASFYSGLGNSLHLSRSFDPSITND